MCSCRFLAGVRQNIERQKKETIFNIEATLNRSTNNRTTNNIEQ